MTAEVFGTGPAGEEVLRVTLRGGGLTAQVMTWGAVLQDLRLDGHAAPLVLGFPEFAPYLTHSPYFGATAGRCANRVRDGHLEIDGQTWQLDRNFLGKHCLHGGRAGMGKRNWVLERHDGTSATLSITQADGDMGFPGNLTVRVTYSLLPGGVLDIVFRAETDKPTLCNIAHHSYFNLDGGDDVRDHLLQVVADATTPTDAELIPTGEVREVTGTPHDFRAARPIGTASAAGVFDHNFCVSAVRQSLRPVGRLSSPVSGVAMEIRTTEPGLQVYDGAKIDIPLPGLQGRPMGPRAGVAIEPQVWPDANHHPDFPQALLRPGETYRQHSQFAFSRD